MLKLNNLSVAAFGCSFIHVYSTFGFCILFYIYANPTIYIQLFIDLYLVLIYKWYFVHL